LTGVFSANTVYLLFAASGIVLSAVYSIWLFNRICFGTLKIKYISKYIDLNKFELASFIPLIILMLFLGINSIPILELIQNNIAWINIKY
jgi:NADH-quinone oxidoreductase subunit M